MFEDLGLAVHGQGYARRDVTEDLTAGYPEPRPGLLNVGLLHTALEGREGHDLYAPCTVERLVSRGYDYWALGHVHRREVVREDPWIVFPGNLQGRHARETGPKGATLVSVDGGRITAVEHRPLDVLRWTVCEVDVAEAASGHDVVDQVRAALETEAAGIGDRTLAARVRVVGRSRAHRALRAERERWVQEIRAASLGLAAPVWVEKVQLETRPQVDLAERLRADDPVAGLIRELPALARDEQTLGGWVRALAPLTGRLPAEYRQLPEADRLDLESPATLAALLPEVERELVSRLLESAEDE